MRIVDDDSGFVVDVVVVDDDDGSGGGFTIVGFCWVFDVGKTTAGDCLLSDICVVLTKGFADADKDGFLERWWLLLPTVLSYRCRYSSVLNFAVGCWGLFIDRWSTYWINNSVNDLIKNKDIFVFEEKIILFFVNYFIWIINWSFWLCSCSS